MKIFVISDNNDTYTGLKLVGADGVVARTKEEVIAAVERALKDKSIGLILITEKLRSLAGNYVSDKMNTLDEPLFLEIPDRHGFGRSKSALGDFISTSIGLKI
jgi:V/A-type H+-transporting ATPase subunit F